MKAFRHRFVAITATLAAAVFSLLICSAGIPAFAQASDGWRVWIRTDPCPGRFDWLSVAKDPPAGGSNTYVPYETLLGNQGCTTSGPKGCTFEQATALMESLRNNDKLLDLCCKDYSVWENIDTGKRTVVLGKQGNPGAGFRLIKGDLCCEQAEDVAGIPGACSGSHGGGKGGGGIFGGKWSVTSALGDLSVDLTQASTRVTGSFTGPYLSGTLTGTIAGDKFTFTWKGGEYTGTGQVTIAKDGRSFTGFWMDDESHTSVPITGTKSR